MYHSPTVTVFACGLFLSSLNYGKFYKAVCITPTFLGFRARTFLYFKLVFTITIFNGCVGYWLSVLSLSVPFL